jgi:threonyl-tRNA synthetase
MRFNLQYRTADNTEEESRELYSDDEFTEKPLKPGYERPVIIHRAILGSLERQIAVLAEHTAGKWPFWLSPRQAIVLPISNKFNEYANSFAQRLRNEGYKCDLDTSSDTIGKKVRTA